MNIKLINSRVTSILRSIPHLTLPINIIDIAKSRGLLVIPYELGNDVSGLLSIQGGVGTIGYNKEESEARKRFTIAHELGHYELHKDKSDLFVDKQFIYRSANSGDTPVKLEMEQEANFFASSILMPTNLLRKKIEKNGLDLGDEYSIADLAKTFEVSVAAMSIRIASLGLI